MRRRPFLLPLLASLCALASAQDDRIIDVKQIIKDTLDVMRSYPAPPILTHPQAMMALTQQTPLVMPDSSQMASAALPQPQPPALQSQRYGQALPVAGSYGQATSQPVHQPLPPQPLPQPPTQQQASYGPAVARGVSTYGGQRYYGSSAIQQNTPIYSGTYGPSAQVPSLPRIFATPTQQDLERLFHLPADIVHRLAADAGYIDPDPELYSSYSSSASRYSGNSGGGGSGFNFNIQDGSKPASTDIASFFFPQAAATTVAPRPVIVAAGTPKITTRTVVRNGKTIELPLMVVPLRNGQTASIPYENLHDLSEAVHKIITTGELTLPEPVSKPAPAEPNPINAVATNLLFGNSLPQGPPLIGTMPEHQLPIDHIQIEPPTTARPMTASTKKIIRTESNAFVQEIDETTTPQPTTAPPPPPTTRATPAPAAPTIGQEIVLNGLRYKLVDNVTGAMSRTPVGAPRLRLKSAPTRVAAGGPLALPSANQIANFGTAQNNWPEQPSAAQQRPSMPSMQLQPAQSPQQSLQQPIVPAHVATIPQAATRRQPLVATVSVPPRPTPPATEAPSMESQMDDEDDKRMTEQPMRRVFKTSEIEQPPVQRPYNRQYSLKELEEIINGAKEQSEESDNLYRRQKADKVDMSNPESVGEKQARPRRLTIHPMDNAYNPEKQQTRSEGPIEHGKNRIEELRRKFANDRRMLAEKTKRIFRHDLSKASSPSGVTEQHCQNIRSFARQFGTLDVSAFAHNNCRFIENYYPDLKCSKVSEYMAECAKYLRF